MRYSTPGVILLAFAVTTAFAEAQSTKPPESYSEVDAAHRAAVAKYLADFKAEYDALAKKDPEAAKNFTFSQPDPSLAFAPRFLAAYDAAPKAPNAFEALVSALALSFGQEPTLKQTRTESIIRLRRDFVEKPEIKQALRVLTMLENSEEGARTLVDEVIARNPDRGVQAAAYLCRLDENESLIRIAEDLKKPERRAVAEKNRGKSWVLDQFSYAEQAKSRIDSIKSIIMDKYSDFYLSLGHPIPEVVSQNLDGKTVRVSELKGKVVVLDIWATWCGPCKAMIPHEREMVERLKDKPFQLVSISVDEKKETLRDFLAKEKMPWTHWWNGTSGPAIETLNIRSYPTIFVLDPKGVVRYRDLRGEKLEKAVNELLKEAEAKKTAAR